MSEAGSPDWQQWLRQMLGEQAAAEIIRDLQARGFNPQSGDLNMFAGMSEGLMSSLMAHAQNIFNQSTGPLNWDLARQTAQGQLRGQADPPVTTAMAGNIKGALSAANLWVDAVTEMAPPAPDYAAWSRTNWLDNTAAVWREIADPVAQNAAAGLVQVLEERLGSLGEMGGDNPLQNHLSSLFQISGTQGPGGLAQLMSRLSSMLFGMQLGQGLASLARESFGSTDIGLPLTTGGTAALLPVNIEDFAQGLVESEEDILAFLATREVAYTRLYHAVPWLRGQVLGAIRKYAGEIRFNLESMGQAAQNLELSDMGSFEDALKAGLLRPESSPAQQAALEDLEVLLALMEAWVEEITAAALAPYVPRAGALREMMRRRRATGGPAEQAFTGLIGLEMRPKRVRQAVALLSGLNQKGGGQMRDHLWSHPDLLPTSADLDDPADFLARAAGEGPSDEMEADLQALLEGSLGYAVGLEPGKDSKGDAEASAKTEGEEGPGQS